MRKFIESSYRQWRSGHLDFFFLRILYDTKWIYKLLKVSMANKKCPLKKYKKLSNIKTHKYTYKFDACVVNNSDASRNVKKVISLIVSWRQ